MKTTRQWMTAAAALAAALLIAGSARADLQIDARIQIRPRPTKDLQVAIWPDRGEGADYRPGDDIAMYVEANRDCFLILYNIDTQGRLNILFPYDPWTDNFVRGGEVIRFPRPQEAQDWMVEGPPGVEYVQAIASTFPITPPDWPVYLRSVNGRDAVSYDRDLNDFWSYDDRLSYIRVVNRKITRRHWERCATDLATFQVRPPHWWLRYQPTDPWPDEFYGEIFIGWPVGGAIFVDGVFIGHAPIHVPRHRWGRHVVTCYVGNRLVQRHKIDLWPKVKYRYHQPVYRNVDVFAQGHVKLGKPGHPTDDRPDPPVKRRVGKVRTENVSSRGSNRAESVRNTAARTTDRSNATRLTGRISQRTGTAQAGTAKVEKANRHEKVKRTKDNTPVTVAKAAGTGAERGTGPRR
ncbi:MAG TPA: DUF4384 domain-containing protein [Acidobacteriota bacterium]|nr:DUF4384 domain-containing protein [Acidobacteriota bacterium]